MGIVHGAWFLTDWDAGSLVHAAVFGIGDNAEYFSYYPNQTFLLGVFTLVANCFPDNVHDAVYYALVVGGCVS